MKRVSVLMAAFILCVTVAWAADGLPAINLPPVTVQGLRPSQERVGPYNQPQWTARGRFSSDTAEEERSDPEYELDIGPNFTVKPSERTRLDLAALFGVTDESPALGIYAVFSIAFGEGAEKDEGEAPVSTQHR